MRKQNRCCDNCDWYKWYFDWCDKWDVEKDERSVCDEWKKREEYD